MRSSRHARGAFTPWPSSMSCSIVPVMWGIELGPYLRRLALQVFEAYGVDRERIRLTWQADAVDVGANTAMPCGLLVHEVLSNCLLHAFPAQQIGSVAITLQAEPAGQVILTICDMGIGVPPNLEGHEGESFGLDLIRALTEQLQGTLVVTRTRGDLCHPPLSPSNSQHPISRPRWSRRTEGQSARSLGIRLDPWW